MRVYLDNAATTPIAPEALDAMMPYLTDHYGNPSSQHSYGREARAAVEQARKLIAGHIGAKAGEIIFTSGGTESSNLALMSAVRDHGVKRIITSSSEHHCVLHTAEWLKENYGIAVDMLSVDNEGKVSADEINDFLSASAVPSLVSVMHANNETGVMSDIGRIGNVCRDHKALFHSDTVQTIAHHVFDLAVLHIHYVTGSAHKFHGPKGTGFLFVRKGQKISPLLHGGGQERNRRAGTENVAGIVGMAKALDLAYRDHRAEKEYVSGLKYYFLNALRRDFEDLEVNGPEGVGEALYTVLNVSFPADERGALALFNLDMEGVCASGGSACNSGASAASHVISAMGKDPQRTYLRFSFSRYNSIEELNFALEKLRKVFNRMRAI